VLGKANTDGISYVDVALKNNSTYFSLNDSIWKYLNEKYGENFMWLVNQRFIEQQAAKKVIFNFSHDITLYKYGYYAKEIDFLFNNFSELMGRLVN
jgi:hypothetical protein